MKARSRRDRSWIWLALSDLLEANLAMELTRREHAASTLPETAQRYELATAIAKKLRSEAEVMINHIGTEEERDRLATMLNFRFLAHSHNGRA
jgi:hypothetical protein